MTTSSLPQFYSKVAPLNKEKHGSLRIEPLKGYDFARGTNSVYIAAVEFGRAAREYPIVFGRGGDNSVFPVVLLGLENGQNVYVDGKGNWRADYIPAYVRRYPFILAAGSGNGESSFIVCIDEDYPGFTQNTGKGRPLFDESGQETELLRKSLDFLKEYQGHIELTRSFCAKLQELELLEAVRADISLPDGGKQALGGFFCVGRERLRKLDDTQLGELVRKGFMELVDAHLLSLDNLNRLLQRSPGTEGSQKKAASKVN